MAARPSSRARSRAGLRLELGGGSGGRQASGTGLTPQHRACCLHADRRQGRRSGQKGQDPPGNRAASARNSAVRP